jgi:hypothetical protein
MNRLILAMLFVFTMASNVMAQSQTVYAQSSVKCVGTELDGSITLRVNGYGRNRADAREQAMKNAVWAVIFDGVRDGVPGTNVRPLVTEVNARERYEEYFDIFFSDNGVYREYVSLRDTRKFSEEIKKDKQGYSYSITVRVLRSELKARLRADNLID